MSVWRYYHQHHSGWAKQNTDRVTS